jgi:hypothetical protein
MSLMPFRYKLKDKDGNIFERVIWKNNLKDVSKYLLKNELTIEEDLNTFGFKNEIFKKIKVNNKDMN